MTEYQKCCGWVTTSPQPCYLPSKYEQRDCSGYLLTPSSMYYHFAILLLFRPLIKLRIIGSKVLPRDVCSQAADAIQGLSRSYSQLYTLRRTPSFVPYFVLTSAIMHLTIGAADIRPSAEPSPSGTPDIGAEIDPHVTEAISQGISDLAEMAPCHHFAHQALNILRYLTKKWNIKVDTKDAKFTAEEYERFVRPQTNSLNFFAPNIKEEDFVCTWGIRGPLAGKVVAATTQGPGETIENPLFWPFPMQGRPILPSGDALEQAGFVMLR